MSVAPGPELLLPAEMALADRLAIEAGQSGEALMARAAAAVAAVLFARWAPQPVLILCGPGNNGGDGYALAPLLQAAGWPVRLAALAPPRTGSDAALFAARWQGPVEPLTEDLPLTDGLVVDALFGAGLDRPLPPAVRHLLARVESARLPLVAVDVPSGLDGASGEPLGYAPQATETVTFFRAKPGHLVMPGRALCGRLTVADIGIPADVLSRIRPLVRRNDPADWAPLLPRPGLGSHKFSRGYLVIRGGLRMTGAARLAAQAARRVGAGLVTLSVPETVWPLYAAAAPGTLVDGKTWPAALSDGRRTAFLIGPGLGLGAATRRMVGQALATAGAGVLDADALSAFAGEAGELRRRIAGPLILTPHAGEFARLFAGSPVLAAVGRLAQVRAAARFLGAVVVLKGADSLIAHPSGRVAVETDAPNWLATAGSGDVLAGLAAGLLAQGLAPFEAARVAVGLHAAAGRRAGAGLIAEDLPDLLPQVLAEWLADAV